jgi:dipeptidase E
MVKDNLLDGRRLFEDITFEDSMGYTFYVLEDGSYVLSDETGETLYGNAYVIRDGKMEMICSEDESVKLS